MFMLAGLMGLVIAGLAVDMTGIAADKAADDAGNDDRVGADLEPDLPPIMPDADDPDGPAGESHTFPQPAPQADPAHPGPYAEGSAVDPWADSFDLLDLAIIESDIRRLIGGDDADVLMGGDQADHISGFGGMDDLRGGLGNDTILAGAGDDWVQGDGGYGEGGDDLIFGGEGNDSLAGQAGNDIIHGGAGSDTIFGGEGDDSLAGGAGDDWISGNDGDDTLISGGGADDLDGGRGNDLLVGDDDHATVWMHGGEGDDKLMPGAGDFAEGLAGADTFVLRQTDGEIPIIADYDSREDQVELHMPGALADEARIELHEDRDGTLVIRVNGDPVGRLLQGGGLRVADIAVVRHSA